MGATRRSARTEPYRPDRRGSAWRFAELGPAGFFAGQAWPGDVGRGAGSPAGREAPVAARESPARLGRCSCRRGAGGTRAACSADLGSAHARTDSARRSDLGRAASTTALDATTRPSGGACSAATSAARGGQLGGHRCAAGAGLGCTTACRAQGTGTSAAPAGAPAGGRSATSPDLGVAPRRGSATSRRSRSLVGLRPAGRSCFQTSVDRLGSACGQLSASDASCAVMERAGRGIVVGRAQERGARGPRSAVVGSAAELTRATGVVTASGR